MRSHRGRKKPERLAEKLLAIRFKLDVSQSQLASLLGLDKSAARISEYERGIREPDLMTLLKYSKLVRVAIEVLVDDTIELEFPASWKRPRRITDFLRQQRRVTIQNRNK